MLGNKINFDESVIGVNDGNCWEVGFHKIAKPKIKLNHKSSEKNTKQNKIAIKLTTLRNRSEINCNRKSGV